MPKICYEVKTFSKDKAALIEKANTVISDYRAQGFTLTLRQLYYQFVSRDLLPQSWADKNGVLNRPESYDKLGVLISDARMAGLIDWLAIVDRGRNSRANSHWDNPSDIIDSAASSYANDKWVDQRNYVEVWVEKEALEDVLQQACGPLDVRYFACKGYTSQSAMWEASQRLLQQHKKGKKIHIIHLGDHDPSGIDMSRDILDRLSIFTRRDVPVNRIALNMNQVEQYNPPPNPAKTTDSRYKSYQESFGDESWELDALEPAVLLELITEAVKGLRDEELWDEAVAKQEQGRSELKSISSNYEDTVAWLENEHGE